MTLWRISNHISLGGEGGLRAPARWHTRGRRIVYLAASPASALLEIIVHLEVREATIPEGFQLLKLDAPDQLSRHLISPGDLTRDWEDDSRVTRKLGDRWLSEGQSALLAVPSAIVPETENWLLNPVHPDAGQIRLEWNRRFPYDGRLFRGHSQRMKPVTPVQ